MFWLLIFRFLCVDDGSSSWIHMIHFPIFFAVDSADLHYCQIQGIVNLVQIFEGVHSLCPYFLMEWSMMQLERIYNCDIITSLYYIEQQHWVPQSTREIVIPLLGDIGSSQVYEEESLFSSTDKVQTLIMDRYFEFFLCSYPQINDSTRGLTGYFSKLVQIMVRRHQARDHYWSQYWPRSVTQYGVARPQWVNNNSKNEKRGNMDMV